MCAVPVYFALRYVTGSLSFDPTDWFGLLALVSVMAAFYSVYKAGRDVRGSGLFCSALRHRITELRPDRLVWIVSFGVRHGGLLFRLQGWSRCARFRSILLCATSPDH